MCLNSAPGFGVTPLRKCFSVSMMMLRVLLRYIVKKKEDYPEKSCASEPLAPCGIEFDKQEAENWVKKAIFRRKNQLPEYGARKKY